MFDKIETGENLPVSQEQARMWIIAFFSPTPAYNIPFTYSLTGHVDIVSLRKSLTEIVKRHSILRSRVKTEGASARLSVEEAFEVPMEIVDFSNEPLASREDSINEYLSIEIRTPFKIAEDILFRIHLLKRSDSEVIFHMTIHHIIFDGWSWGIFVRELNAFYRAFVAGESLTLPVPDNQYYEFAAWQKSCAEDERFVAASDYWTGQLEGGPLELNFPYDYERPDASDGLGQRVSFSVPPDLYAALKEVSRQHGATEFVTYISIFALLLEIYSEDTDICIGIPSANRLTSNLEQMIGLFMNTLVMRFEVSPDKSFSDYLKEGMANAKDAIKHQELPFEKVVELIKPPRVMNRNPIFQVMFAWLNTPRPPIEFSGVQAERYTVRKGVSPLDLSVYMWVDSGVLEGEIEFNSSLLKEATVQQLAVDYIEVLNLVAKCPNEVLADYNLFV